MRTLPHVLYKIWSFCNQSCEDYVLVSNHIHLLLEKSSHNTYVKEVFIGKGVLCFGGRS